MELCHPLKFSLLQEFFDTCTSFEIGQGQRSPAVPVLQERVLFAICNGTVYSRWINLSSPGQTCFFFNFSLLSGSTQGPLLYFCCANRL